MKKIQNWKKFNESNTNLNKLLRTLEMMHNDELFKSEIMAADVDFIFPNSDDIEKSAEIVGLYMGWLVGKYGKEGIDRIK